MSIDGRKEVHDHMRPFRNGSGSYDLIRAEVREVCREQTSGRDYYVRGTFTQYNKDFADRRAASCGSGI